MFAYLVAKGLYRIGVDLNCPHCRLDSWIAVDFLEQKIVCDKCGREYDSTRQLVASNWRFRRSGVLGMEKNSQGAVPVALTLQQIENTFPAMSGNFYSPSLDVTLIAGTDRPRELDFVWITHGPYWRTTKTVVVIGECKDSLPIDANDFANLQKVADAFPSQRFDVFILLAKLCPFTDDELAHARKLNEGRQPRVILLTHRELEPYDIFERTKKECVFTLRGHAPEDLALAFAEIYFKGLPPAASK